MEIIECLADKVQETEAANAVWEKRVKETELSLSEAIKAKGYISLAILDALNKERAKNFALQAQLSNGE